MKIVLIDAILVALVAAVIQQVADLKLTAIGWALPLAVSLFVLGCTNWRKSNTLLIWLPWTMFAIVTACLSPFENALVRVPILITPYMVGAAAERLDYSETDYPMIIRRIFWAGVLVTIVVPLKVVVLGGDKLHLLATESIASVALFWVILLHLTRKPSAAGLALGGMLAAIPAISASRMALFAAATWIPVCWRGSLRTKVAAVAVFMAMCGILLSLPEIQNKMVYKGHSLSEAFKNPALLQTSGRLEVWKFLAKGIAEEPILGHGADSTEIVGHIFGTTDFDHPHNDWLRLLYEYGILGLLLFLATIGVQLLTLRGMLRRKGPHSLFLEFAARSASTLFVPFVCLMVTDNILFYGAFFGNLHFFLIGLASAVYLSEPTVPAVVGALRYENL